MKKIMSLARVQASGWNRSASWCRPRAQRCLHAFVKSELDLWTRVIKTAGIKPE
jgi:hypothetical protein